jgi:putative ABC transport system permease protein
MRRALLRLRVGLTTLTGTGAGASLVLAFLVIATVFVAVAMPRASLAYRTNALTRIIHTTSAPGRTVVATTEFSDLAPALSPASSGQALVPTQISQVGDEVGKNIVKSGVPLQPASDRWWGMAASYLLAPHSPKAAHNGSTPPQVEVLYRPALPAFSRLVSGRLPIASLFAETSATFQVAVTTATAAKWHIRPGTVLKVNSNGIKITLTVTGILRPLHAQSSFWTQDPNAAAVTFNSTRSGGYWLGAVFVAPSALVNLESAFSAGNLQISWEYPLALGSVNANQAGQLSASLNSALQTAGILQLKYTVPPDLSLSSGLANPLALFVGQQGQIGSLLALLYVSLTVVSAVVLLLGDTLLAERRATEFRLIRARGAGRRQLALLALRAGAVVVLPAAVLGALVGVALTPGGGEPLSWWLAALTALVALAGVPLLAVRGAYSSPGTRPGADVPLTRAARARRLVLDVTLIAAAIGGIVVLRSQGAPPPGSTNWYTSASPALVAVPAAIVMVRLYPVVVGWLVRLAGRRHGVSAYVGLARAVRSSVSGVLPVFALVLALGVIAFGATLRTAVVRGDEAASWSATGADAVINAANSSLPLNAATRREIDAVPGVRRSTVATVLPGTAADGTTLAVVVVNPASYAALIGSTPSRPFPLHQLTRAAAATPAGSIPALASPGAAAAISHGPQVLVEIRSLRLSVAGRISSVPGVPDTTPFVVVPYQQAARALGTSLGTPNLMLIAGAGVDGRKLTAAAARLLPGAIVSLRSTVLNSLTSAPLPHGAYVSFAQGAAAAAALGAVILAIMLALGARPRELTLARLLTMGLSPAQARRLVVAEVLPAIVAATAGGVACAWALVTLLGSAVDLSPLTGTPGSVPVRPDYAVLGYLAASLLVLALATLLAQAAATRFRGVARALRVGE